MPVSIPINATAQDSVIDFLKNASDSYDMNVDGSVTPVDFGYTVSKGHNLLVTSLNIIVADTKIDPQDFGGQPALTNGLQLFVQDANGKNIADLFGGNPVKANYDFGHLVGIDWFTDRGAKTEVITAQLGLAASNIVVSLPPRSRLHCEVRDDLSDLAHFTITIQGFYYRQD